MKTDPIKRAIKLRETLVRTGEEKEALLADLTKTLQGKDTSRVIDMMPNSRGEYVLRTKYCLKEMDVLAHGIYSKGLFNVEERPDAEIEDLVKRAEFDFPLWFKPEEGFTLKKICDYNVPLILQIAGCNFHDGSETGGCWYCFVDDAVTTACLA